MLYVTYTLNFLLMLGLPFGLGALLSRRLGIRWGLFWVGAVTFIGSQVVHVPLNIALGRLGLLAAGSEPWRLPLTAVVAGLSAGVSEELARYLVLRFWLKRDRSWRAALMFGAGHGGVEAVIVGVLAATATINIFVLRNVDPSQLGVLPAQLPAIQRQLAAAWSVPVFAPLLGALERVSALCTHLWLAVMVMQAFTRNNKLWLLGAIGWHAAVDAVSVYAVPGWGPYITEALIAIFALIGVGLIFALRQPEPTPVAPAARLTSPVTADDRPRPTAAPTAEQLERTRYQ